jgi:hypothetical protein
MALGTGGESSACAVQRFALLCTNNATRPLCGRGRGGPYRRLTRRNDMSLRAVSSGAGPRV